MNNFPFIDIFILAMIAVFILNRLRNSLGKKTGNETDLAQKLSQKPSKVTESNPDKEIEKNKNQVKEAKNIILHKNSSINEKLNNIVKVDPSFTVENFIDGAKKAFEYILVKYSENDLNSLKSLSLVLGPIPLIESKTETCIFMRLAFLFALIANL